MEDSDEKVNGASMEANSTAQEKEEGSSSSAQQAPSSLQGLFQPPPTTGSTGSDSQPPGSSSLMNLFQPASTQPSAMQPLEGNALKSSGLQESSSHEDGVGSDSHFESLFQSPPARNEIMKEDSEGSAFTIPQSLLERSNLSERALLLSHNQHQQSDSLNSYASLGQQETPKTSTVTRKHARQRSSAIGVSNMPAISEVTTPQKTGWTTHLLNQLKSCYQSCLLPTTYIGALMFLLYQIVFTLTMGSAIVRPSTSTSILGPMTKMAALGVLFGGPWYLLTLGGPGEIPAIYPTTDLFLAPFLAHLAVLVDHELDPDASDEVFLATFGVCAAIGMLISATLLLLASVFRLANLGSYLPFPVLCGFFASVGILTWTLAFKVDTAGKSIGMVLKSGDGSLIGSSLLHHFPSVALAAAMKWLGPKHPAYVVALLFGFVTAFYMTMFVLGFSMEEAREAEWFWTKEDLMYVPQKLETGFGFAHFAPPAPFGVLACVLEGKVNWRAVYAGIPTTCALGFLYLIRCSLHGTALKKNVTNLAREENTVDESQSPKREAPMQNHRRLFSEDLDVEAILTLNKPSEATTKCMVHAQPTRLSLQEIIMQYGMSQYVSALVGSFGVVPSVAAAPTMYSLWAEGRAPQLGSIILLSLFYLTNYRLVLFVPKAAFSSVLVLAFIDMTHTWFVKSYFKTKEKAEWLVVPLIVIFASLIGLLSAVFLGIALSTFIFVANFFRSGVVKFVASGLTIRSTIERPVSSAGWLEQNGDLIQLLVLQNYLFFGNASSVLGYINSMFEDPEGIGEQLNLPPKPKFVILDMTLVTGMDTSTCDVFLDILTVCSNNNCKLFLAGVSSNLRTILALGGVKSGSGQRKKRKLRFFATLDSAVGKAEDMLLDAENQGQVHSSRRRNRVKGFRLALVQIDEEHGMSASKDLLGLEKYTTPIELTTGEILYDGDSVDLERGIFFIEYGIMKIERSTEETLTRNRSMNRLDYRRYTSAGGMSLDALNARSGSIGRQSALLKSQEATAGETSTLRLARIGPGWVLGTLEAVSGMLNPGIQVAVTDCRLHHLSYKKMEELEEQDPALVLRLYKILSHLMAKRQEVTIGQLATLQSIMTSPALTKPISRQASSTFQAIG